MLKGTKHTKETKKKMRESHKGKTAWNKDLKTSLIIRKKMSEAKKGTKYSKDRKTNSEAMKKYWANLSEEERKKINRKISKSNKEFWFKKSVEEKRILTKNWSRAGFLGSQRASPSSIEKMIYKILDSLNIKYLTQHRIGRWYIDIFIPNKRLIIECNGNYWHNLPKVIKRDKRLQEYCDENNYKLIWLWEHEIRENPKQAFFNALEGEKIARYV